jgi:hypothetical protein
MGGRLLDRQSGDFGLRYSESSSGGTAEWPVHSVHPLALKTKTKKNQIKDIKS